MGTFTDIVRGPPDQRKPNCSSRMSLAYPEGKRGHATGFPLKSREHKDYEPSETLIRCDWFWPSAEIILSEKGRQGGQYDSSRFCLNIAVGKNSNEFHVFMETGLLCSLVFDFGLARFIRLLRFSSESKSEGIKEITPFLGQQVKAGKNWGAPYRTHADPVFLLNRSSIAPIRSKPKRTYDPLKEAETPEGSEMPMVLMRLSATSKDEWAELKRNILDFGKVSGLFTDIKVRHLGKLGDPFQLQITVRGPRSNLMDVGYGVSQVLPILVRILREKKTRFLLQQPEVHLHPKGQAELTSLFVDVIKKRQNSFVIETHSDYMIDRARIEIMKGRLNPEDVSLIYLEPVQNKVMVHNISFDSEGNMNGVPHGYRAFFLKESDKLLGFGE